MEVEGSLRHFGGRWQFLARLRAGLPHLGFEARIAEAPTARAALWLARGGGGRLEALPVAVTGCAPQALELLGRLGIRTVGGLLRLPREGVARRFAQCSAQYSGLGLLEQLDQAGGKVPEAREFFVPSARFAARLELPAPVMQAEHALFAARRLLAQMEGFLAARQAGVRVFTLALVHDGLPATAVKVGLATPGCGAEHFARLLRERLARTVLCAAVEAIEIEAGDIEVLAQASGSFFTDPHAGGEEWLRLVERLQARLGSEAVHGLKTHPDHRPERAFRSIVFAMKNSNSSEKKKEKGKEKEKDLQSENAAPRPCRPLWLLDPPRRLAEGEFTLLAGPERIESGWWDGAEARRDYFIARTGEASLAWIYRERGAQAGGDWFLHGLFA